MNPYKIMYEDINNIEDSICIMSNYKPSITETRHILSRCGIRKCKIIDIVLIES